MSEIRINVIDKNQTISGTMHGSFGDILVASLTAEPETVEELKTVIERFIKPESDWSVFRSFKGYENFEPWDAGLLVIDLTAKASLADSTYSYYSTNGTVQVRTDDDENFSLPYKLSDQWKTVGSMPEFLYAQTKGHEKASENPLLDARQILFGKPLFEFIFAEYLSEKTRTDENLFTEIHAKWLMNARDDLHGKTPREILLEKQDFIDADLHSRSLQWSFTGIEPPPLPKSSNAYKFSGFGTHEIVVYYDLFRFLLNECFEENAITTEKLEQIAGVWLNNPQAEFSGRTPMDIIEKERQRINLTVSARECMIDDDCEVCRMMAVDFIDTPMFWHLDGSQMEYDRFEFSFYKTREEWNEELRQREEFDRKFNEKYNSTDDDFFDRNQEIIE